MFEKLSSADVAKRLTDLFNEDFETGLSLIDIHTPCSMSLPSKANIEVAGVYRTRPIIDGLSVINGFLMQRGGCPITLNREGERQVPREKFSFWAIGQGDPFLKVVSAEDLVAYLNLLVLADLGAMYSLFAQRVECNENMSARVDVPVIADGGIGFVSWLSVANMICGYEESGMFVTWDITNDNQLLGFRAASWADLDAVSPSSDPRLEISHDHAQAAEDTVQLHVRG